MIYIAVSWEPIRGYATHSTVLRTSSTKLAKSVIALKRNDYSTPLHSTLHHITPFHCSALHSTPPHYTPLPSIAHKLTYSIYCSLVSDEASLWCQDHKRGHCVGLINDDRIPCPSTVTKLQHLQKQ